MSRTLGLKVCSWDLLRSFWVTKSLASSKTILKIYYGLSLVYLGTCKAVDLSFELEEPIIDFAGGLGKIEIEVKVKAKAKAGDPNSLSLLEI